ncbi:hypothetical protein B7494_g1335 [Chlorociboria aeruginascens]|nr:hypothetical protein B7494_g1335 [Chlorociboria aeruginascens]
MSASPLIEFLGPSNLTGYERNLQPSQQPAHIPKTFLDAMEVREQVFVVEQGIPLESEYDPDDSRACHWVIYASVNSITEPERKDAVGNIIKAQKSSTQTKPIGTIRLVPFPHEPHPEPGSSYFLDALNTNSELSLPPFIVDRATTYHDGKEPYIKLGRVAVVKEFRGTGIANILVNTALTWARQNPRFFNPTKCMGMEKTGASSIEEIPVWKGLMCVHAQEQVANAWAKWGFYIDGGMGTWFEEGIRHVGMFQRLHIQNQGPRLSE